MKKCAVSFSQFGYDVACVCATISYASDARRKWVVEVDEALYISLDFVNTYRSLLACETVITAIFSWLFLQIFMRNCKVSVRRLVRLFRDRFDVWNIRRLRSRFRNPSNSGCGSYILRHIVSFRPEVVGRLGIYGLPGLILLFP